MNVIKKTCAILALTVISLQGFSQSSLCIYPLSNTLGVKFKTDSKFSPEFRLGAQVDLANGEANLYVQPQAFFLFNYLQEDNFLLYSGLGLGGNIYNQASTNFIGSLPFGATYFLSDSKRFGLLAECGLQLIASASIQLKTYATIGLQIRLEK